MKDAEPLMLGYYGPYLERVGIGVRAMAEQLVEPPERPLSEEERKEVQVFANSDIHQMQVEVGADTPKTLESIIRDCGKSQGSRIFAAAFIGEHGKEAAEKLGIDVPFMMHAEDVYRWLVRAVDSGLFEDSTLQSIAKHSLDRYKINMASALLSHNSIDTSELDNMPINFDPELAIQSAKDAQAARRQLLVLRQQYGRGPMDVDQAKRVVVDVYLAKLNALIAGNAGTLLTVYEQAELTGNRALADEAKESLGGFRCIVENNDASERAMKRLDYLINGIGINKNGVADTISAELENAVGGFEEEGEGAFSPEQVRVLRSTKISVDRMKEGFENILSAAGVLSSEDATSWSPKQKRRAADNKFRVVKQPTKTTFEVTALDGTYKVASVERSLYDVLVVAGFHELCHIDQALADYEFAKEFAIGEVNGKRVGGLREPAANALQRQAERLLFGKSKPVAAPTYLQAKKALRAGGTLADATHAFFVTQMNLSPDTPPEDAARDAADRVLRLMRFHGYNSQPFVYAEEGVMINELKGADPAVISRAGAITSIDLVDQLRLHRFGLLPKAATIRHDWAGLVFKEFLPDIEAALKGAGVPIESTILFQEGTHA